MTWMYTYPVASSFGGTHDLILFVGGYYDYATGDILQGFDVSYNIARYSQDIISPQKTLFRGHAHRPYSTKAEICFDGTVVLQKP